MLDQLYKLAKPQLGKKEVLGSVYAILDNGIPVEPRIKKIVLIKRTLIYTSTILFNSFVQLQGAYLKEDRLFLIKRKGLFN